MTESEYERVKSRVKVIAQEIAKTLENLIEDLKMIFNELPPYLKYEYTHPRKKPRGSLRRWRKEKNNGE